MTDFQSRYVAYARSHGREPAAQIAHDAERWPTAPNVGFITWLDARWAEWSAVSGREPTVSRSDAEHAAFDQWLSDRTDRLYEHAERLANNPRVLADMVELERRLAAGGVS